MTATFRERVLDFWKWFPTVSDSVADALRSGENVPEQLAEFIEDVREKIGGLAWVFGPGESEERFSFTVTGEGQTSRQLLSHFWLQNAVEVPGWDFYSSRQPSEADKLADMEIEVAGNKVDAATLKIGTTVDEENQQVDIRAWHEVFEEIDNDARLQILFLLLDEALGEYGTQTKLGMIEFKSDPDTIPLQELPVFLEQLWKEKGWDELSPLETYSGYQGNPSDEFSRADTIAGYTCVPQVVLSYLNEQGSLDDDPVEGSGAEFVYLRVIGGGAEETEDPLEMRTTIEENVAKRLAGGGGYVVGGATGTQDSYIDLVIFDGARSEAAIREGVQHSQTGVEFEILRFVS